MAIYPKEIINVDITGAAEWAWLPVNVVGSILERIESIYDYLRFAAVCKPWLSVARDQYYYKKRLESKSSNRQLPLLLIPTTLNYNEEEDEEEMSRALHTVIGWKTLETKLRVPYGRRRCCGSSHGWLIFADDHNVTLYNPFTAETILLPPITKINYDDIMGCAKQYEVKKVVLSKDPCLSPHDYEVVALYEYNGNVAYFKSGTDAWVYPTKAHFSNIPRLLFDDIIYYNGTFYVVSQKLLACLDEVVDEHDDQVMMLKQVKVRDSHKDIWCYMVESCVTGHLLYIERYPIHHAIYDQDLAHNYPPHHPIRTENGYFKIDDSVHEYNPDWNRLTNYFLVYKVIMENNAGQVEYVQVKDLGDEALFIGHNDAVSVLASNFPGCEPNTIYYTDEYWDGIKGPYMPCGPIDMGFFSLSDSQVPEANRRYMLDTLMSKDSPPPIWIVPKPKL